MKRVKEGSDYYPRSLPVITCAASLAHHGLLGSVKEMRLRHVYLTSVPAKHLASLASSVTERVDIENVHHWNSLKTVLDNVKSKILWIRYQNLSCVWECEALVRAMESRVERVRLSEGVSLEIRDLIKYSGRGKCRRVECYINTAPRSSDQQELSIWAMSKNWKKNRVDMYFIIEKLR